MSFTNTQLTNVQNYNAKSSMLFQAPRKGTTGAISFFRINVGTRNPDGTTGELVIQAPRVYSFGLCETTNFNTGKPDGFTLPLCLQSKDGPTEEEKTFLNTFNDIVNRAKEYVMEIKATVGKGDLEFSELKKMNPILVTALNFII